MIRENDHSSHIKRTIRGCIDLGSSYFRLLVVEGLFPAAGAARGHEALGISSFNEDRRFVGWGDDLARHGAVSPGKLDDAARCLGELIAGARDRGCERPVIVGTNTLRESRNASDVTAHLDRIAHEPIRVLSQHEEAALGFAGAAFFRGRDEALCLIDVGGTSTELSWGRGCAMEGFRGAPLGVHRVQMLLGGESGMRRAAARLAHDLRAADAAAREADQGVYRLPPAFEESTILVTGGTAVGAARALRFMRRETPPFEELERITVDDLVFLRRRLSGLFRAGRERLLPLDANRASLLSAGTVLVEALLLALRIPAFRVTARDLRWGVILRGLSNE
jgi:exopolyphosphatase/guanosine-5'-triphosphate,3'-diphosphate pyrophosphatase